jgi:preprotein translocase subunit SecA
MRLFGSERIASIMDRFGYKEGEVIQHSMITKSIERAQKKVEENNFGIRKRLLEYDDVMNKQRNVVYKKRNHALFGDRLALDLDNAFYIVAEGLINSFQEQTDYEGFKLAAIVNFGIDSAITQEEFEKGKANDLAEKLYQEAIGRYQQKTAELQRQAVPVFQNIRATQGSHIENVVVPFTDNKKGLQVLASLNKTLETHGRELISALERQITLAVIDDAWKEHLRAMDDLKQSVQTAYLEQKDPLVIYKITAYDQFKQMDSDVNKDIISFLCHAGIPVEQQGPGHQQSPVIREGHEQKTDMSRMRANKEEIDARGDDYAANEQDQFDEHVKHEPIRVGPKVGRNDPCPCGSGKKFKNCHGKDVV